MCYGNRSGPLRRFARAARDPRSCTVRSHSPTAPASPMKIPTSLRRAALAGALLVVPVSAPAALAWARPAAAPLPLAQDDEEKE